jgi:hypothetical protein
LKRREVKVASEPDALLAVLTNGTYRSMDHFAGLDVSVKDTSVCIVDGTGKIVRFSF